MDDKVTIVEVGFREGFQKAKCAPSVEALVEMVQKCVDAGYRLIELGTLRHDGYKGEYQSVSEQLFPAAIQRIHNDEVKFQAVIGSDPRDVQMAADCGANYATLVAGASDYFNTQLLEGEDGGYREVMKDFSLCQATAQKCGIELNGAISFPFRSVWEGEIPLENVVNVVKCYLDAGICEISLSDTHGLSNPILTYERTAQLMEKFPQVKWWSHLHNSRGVGIANAWASYQAGIRKFDASFAGVGGCPYFVGSTGNIASEDLIYFFEECGVSTGLDLTKAIEIAEEIEKLAFNSVESYSLRFEKIKRSMGL